MSKKKRGKKRSTARKTGDRGNREYKDSIFRLVFDDRKKVHEICNALGIDCTEDDIRIVTLENHALVDWENDLSFIVKDKKTDKNRLIVLIEHQSSTNKFMTIRFLIYVALHYQMLIDDELYNSDKTIPVPQFVILYNGKPKWKEELKLSELFDEATDSLELKARIYNINRGESPELMEKSRTLEEYSIFVDKVRYHGEGRYGSRLDEALKAAIKECIDEGVLVEFLKIYERRVINMLSRESSLRYEGIQIGEERGIKKAEKKARKENLEIAKSLLGTVDFNIIAEKFKLTDDEIKLIKKNN